MFFWNAVPYRWRAGASSCELPPSFDTTSTSYSLFSESSISEISKLRLAAFPSSFYLIGLVSTSSKLPLNFGAHPLSLHLTNRLTTGSATFDA